MKAHRLEHRDSGVKKKILMGSKNIDDEYKTSLTCVSCREASTLTRVYQGGREFSENFLELKERVKSSH